MLGDWREAGLVSFLFFGMVHQTKRKKILGRKGFVLLSSPYEWTKLQKEISRIYIEDNPINVVSTKK